MKAKLTNNGISYAPKSAKVGNTNQIPPSAEWLSENGYKDVVYTDAPVQDGFYAIPHWTETETEIVQGWELEEAVDIGYTEEGLSAMTNAELSAICADYGFSGSMNRAVMTYLILHAQNETAVL